MVSGLIRWISLGVGGAKSALSAEDGTSMNFIFWPFSSESYSASATWIGNDITSLTLIFPCRPLDPLLFCADWDLDAPWLDPALLWREFWPLPEDVTCRFWTEDFFRVAGNGIWRLKNNRSISSEVAVNWVDKNIFRFLSNGKFAYFYCS